MPWMNIQRNVKRAEKSRVCESKKKKYARGAPTFVHETLSRVLVCEHVYEKRRHERKGERSKSKNLVVLAELDDEEIR